MPVSFYICPAAAADAPAIADLLVRSITELCVADHRNDSELLSGWLANKNTKTVMSWMDNPINILMVAVNNNQVRSVGCLARDGRIILNYVSPDFRFRGASKAMVRTLEKEARRIGLQRLTLDSTETAHAMYLAMGYADVGTTVTRGIPAYQMAKDL